MPTRIGELLVEAGKLDAKELDRATRLQRETAEPLGNLLVQLGFVSERDIAASLAQTLGLRTADADRLRAPAPCVARLSSEFRSATRWCRSTRPRPTWTRHADGDR